MDVSINNPAQLPGAFLFLSIKTKTGEKIATVAYDENIQPKTKLADIRNKYLKALPYNERFGLYDSAKIWEGDGMTSYGTCTKTTFSSSC
jgi:hypothetical protein